MLRLASSSDQAAWRSSCKYSYHFHSIKLATANNSLHVFLAKQAERQALLEAATQLQERLGSQADEQNVQVQQQLRAMMDQISKLQKHLGASGANLVADTFHELFVSRQMKKCVSEARL